MNLGITMLSLFSWQQPSLDTKKHAPYLHYFKVYFHHLSILLRTYFIHPLLFTSIWILHLIKFNNILMKYEFAHTKTRFLNFKCRMKETKESYDNWWYYFTSSFDILLKSIVSASSSFLCALIWMIQSQQYNNPYINN